MPGAETRRRRLRVVALATALLLAAAGSAYAVIGLSTTTDAAFRARAAGPVADRGAGPGSGARPDPGARAGARVVPMSRAEPTTIRARPPVTVPGDRGRLVRELQVRLSQLAWFAPVATGAFGPGTRAAVAGFQGKRGLERTGVVDRRTWRRLVAMTVEPTDAQLFNRPGPTIRGPGDRGREVREVQARLRQIAWYFGDVDGQYDGQTIEAVTGFQGKRGVPATGEVDRRTLELLEAMTTEPTADDLANREPDPAEGSALDPRCRTGPVLCIDKTSQSLRWVHDGSVQETLDVRFGSEELPTREGEFSVFSKSRDHVSSLYDTPMPYAMFFSGGQAVHYSPDFAANGYAGASHGCVNVRDQEEMAALFDEVPLGTRVVVYWS